MKKKSEKAGLKLNIQKTKIMASGPITSWEIDGEKIETVSDFIFLGSKVTEDGDCSHELDRHLLLDRKVMTNLDRVLRSRDIPVSTEIHIFKTMDFPVVMYGCESWTMKAMLHVLSSKSFIVSSLTFKSLIHFEFILFCSSVFHQSSNLHIRSSASFILLWIASTVFFHFS